MALLWGLKFTIAIGIRQFEIEGYSKIIVEDVSRRSAAGWKVEAIVRDVRMLLANLDSFTILHIYTEKGMQMLTPRLFSACYKKAYDVGGMLICYQ